jgi:hypothetical protein
VCDVMPRHVICVLGDWNNLSKLEALVSRVGGSDFTVDREFSQVRPDPRMSVAFEASYDRVSPTMTEEDWSSVTNHSAVLYVLSPPIRRSAAPEISGRALLLTAALLQEGGQAAKGESAGIAHGRAHWLELAAKYTLSSSLADHHTRRATLYWAWVRRPLLCERENVYYSCGMHLLGDRDIEIDSSLDVTNAVRWIDLLGLYLVADQPSSPVRDGEGFRLGVSGPRRVMRHRPCLRYEVGEFVYNPCGYTRLEAD